MKHEVILPGKILGIFGGGQLGRMFAIAARRMGYRVHVFTSEQDSPTGQTADKEIIAAYTDIAAVKQFAQGVKVVTFEFENVASEPLEAIEHLVPVRPSSFVLNTTQHRLREKNFLKANGFPTTRYQEIKTKEHLEQFVREYGFRCVLKTASFGYDGKGQKKINSDTDLEIAWKNLGGAHGILEEWVDFDCEISVIVARGVCGDIEVFPVAENEHHNHILDTSLIPARISTETADQARRIAIDIANQIGLIGVLAVEMFVTKSGKVLINELAPRPHNSGHFSFDACITSQFEQQVRAVCGLPLGSTRLLRPCVMVNILGDIWEKGEPAFEDLMRDPDLKLHLYGKTTPRIGRKMGHFVCLGDTIEMALLKAQAAKKVLNIYPYNQ